MNNKIIAKGAEATILKSNNTITKNRISKSYRHKELDRKLRQRRTKSESKLISKANSLIPSPKLIPEKSKDFEIKMNYVIGDKLSEKLDSYNSKLLTNLCSQIGINIALLHNSGIIHGDLTTSNMIYNKKVYFIDFGLGFHSNRIEDKAVDLHLIKQALEAKHPKIYQKAFKTIISSYSKKANRAKEILKRLEIVESRGRYKRQY